jgi:3-oxoadipate enol-lactonase
VITWDQRGFGNSTRRTGRVGPGPAAGDLAALLDHLEIERAHVVGQSMGGWTSMAFAPAHRDRVRSLVLTDTLAGVSDEEIRTVAMEAFPRALARPEALDVWHPALGPKTCAERPDLAMLYLAITSFGDKLNDGEMLAMLANTRHDLDEVKGLGVPTLAIGGAVPTVRRRAGGEAPRRDVPSDRGGRTLAVFRDAGRLKPHRPRVARQSVVKAGR